MEHKIGERIHLEVVEVKNACCEGCYFEDSCLYWENYFLECNHRNRSDHKNIIYKEIKEE